MLQKLAMVAQILPGFLPGFSGPPTSLAIVPRPSAHMVEPTPKQGHDWAPAAPPHAEQSNQRGKDRMFGKNLAET